MKGIIFTEFLEMIESRHGLAMVDRLIENAHLESNGAYTSVGTYAHDELIRLIAEWQRLTGIPEPILIRDFGVHLFGRLAAAYPGFLVGVSSAPAFLSTIEAQIHVEVRKLYPDAELPHFVSREIIPGHLELIYSSSRPFGDLAEGLILGCIAHFQEPFELTRENLNTGNGITEVRFTLAPSSKPTEEST